MSRKLTMAMLAGAILCPALVCAQEPAPPAQEIDKHAFGVLPNYRTADGSLPFKPITAKYKMTIAVKDSFDGPLYVIGGIFAGIYQLQNQNPSFGQGVKGYAHR